MNLPRALAAHRAHALARGFSVAVVAALVGCGEPPPLKIGFVGGFTSRVGDLGRDGRDGALLAVEEANASGGIDGRRVELLVRDDGQSPDQAAAADQALLDAGVVAVVGHMTSSMSMVGAPIMDAARVPMVSPTTSTNELTGLDDHFLRIYPASRQMAERLAEVALDTLGLSTVSTVVDTANSAHTESWYEAFREGIEARGGRPAGVHRFRSGDQSYRALAEQVSGDGADGVMVLANALDTALLCQHLRALGYAGTVLSSEWSVTADLVRNGGDAVEGIVFFHTVDVESQATAYRRFRKSFTARFGYAPGFAAVHGYDAARVVIRSLARADGPRDLKRAMLEGGSYQGLQTRFTFDRYGDVEREPILMTVRDGHFVPWER